MGRHSIRQYEQHLRSTLPPPPPDSPAAQWRAKARKHHARASRELQKALEADAMADLLEGTPRNEVTR